MSGNEGIIASGHAQVTADVMAVGQGATANKSVAGSDSARDAVLAALDELIAALRGNAARLQDHDELVECAQTVRREIERPEPNRRTVRAMLATLTSDVSSVAALARAVAAVESSIGKLF